MSTGFRKYWPQSGTICLLLEAIDLYQTNSNKNNTQMDSSSPVFRFLLWFKDNSYSMINIMEWVRTQESDWPCPDPRVTYGPPMVSKFTLISECSAGELCLIVLFKHEMRLFEKYSHHREPRAHHSLALVKASLGHQKYWNEYVS